MAGAAQPLLPRSRTEWRELEGRQDLDGFRPFTDLTGGTVPEPMRGTRSQRHLPLARLRRATGDALHLPAIPSRARSSFHRRARAAAPAIADGQHFQETTSWCDKLEEHIDDVGRWIDLRGWRTRAAQRGWATSSTNSSAVTWTRSTSSTPSERLLEPTTRGAVRGRPGPRRPRHHLHRWIDEFRELDRQADRTVPLTA